MREQGHETVISRRKSDGNRLGRLRRGTGRMHTEGLTELCPDTAEMENELGQLRSSSLSPGGPALRSSSHRLGMLHVSKTLQ